MERPDCWPSPSPARSPTPSSPLLEVPLLRERIRRGELTAVRGLTWEAALDRLATGYRLALHAGRYGRARTAA